MTIRSPIIVTVGHIDHGKTTLLDKIRGTSVAKGESGGITQHVGSSYIPLETIKKTCGKLLDKFKIKLTIPGLLLVDTPGHAAFVSLRKRGGSVSDMAILVIDINEGFQEQTYESLSILKEYKTPFVVAATKVDKIQGWFSGLTSFVENLAKQRDYVKDELDKKLYTLVSQLSEKGFESERFDRINDFTKQVAIVPCSGITGEGIPELLMMLCGLSQQFLKDRLLSSKIAKGSVLEVKELKGMGTTIDVILYDGVIRKGDTLIVGGKQPLVTKVKALLRPRELQELRVEKQFETVEEIEAAAGIKISAPGLENTIAGSPVIAVGSEEDIGPYVEEVQKDVGEVEFEKDVEGIEIKADSLGSLEAMIKLLNEEGISIRKADVGPINREDLIETQNMRDELKKVILVFNLKSPNETKALAKDLGVEIFENTVIYRLMEDYKQWCAQLKEREIQKKLESVNHPVELLFLKDAVFRSSHPAVFGVEVVKGLLKAGALIKRNSRIIGRIKEIQKEGKTIEEAKKGDRVAISMEDVTIGRHVFEGDKLFSALSDNDMKVLGEIYDKLSDSEKELLNKLGS
ncbi:MAG: translation initiation factor IF-2 [Candidatus Aenigmarchaeota archaeon]|nr:translation initiation factor IF-2 [Candidatus Aenigmarchaeota archaeon]